MPRVDPLEDIAVAPPPGKAQAAASAGLDSHAQKRIGDSAHRRDLLAKARAFVTLDMLHSSPVRELSLTELHHQAERHGIFDPDREVIETDLRRMLVYCDAMRVQHGQQPLAVRPVEHTLPAELVAERERAANAPPKGLPLSPSGQWRVTAAHRGVSMPGGIYPQHVGTILDVRLLGSRVLEDMARQGLQLEAHPPIKRHTCDACGTSYIESMARACPLCSVREVLDAAAHEVQEVGARAARIEVVLLEQANRADEFAAVLKVQHARHQALARWAVAQGAREPDGDEGTTWQGEPHPPPLERVAPAGPPTIEASPPPPSSPAEPETEAEVPDPAPTETTTSRRRR